MSTCYPPVMPLHNSVFAEVTSICKHSETCINGQHSWHETTHPDLMSSRGRVVRVALHKDEMRGCEVQSAMNGFVAEAIQQPHLLHLQKQMHIMVISK